MLNTRDGSNKFFFTILKFSHWFFISAISCGANEFSRILRHSLLDSLFLLIIVECLKRKITEISLTSCYFFHRQISLTRNDNDVTHVSVSLNNIFDKLRGSFRK